MRKVLVVISILCCLNVFSNDTVYVDTVINRGIDTTVQIMRVYDGSRLVCVRYNRPIYEYTRIEHYGKYGELSCVQQEWPAIKSSIKEQFVKPQQKKSVYKKQKKKGHRR